MRPRRVIALRTLVTGILSVSVNNVLMIHAIARTVAMIFVSSGRILMDIGVAAKMSNSFLNAL